MVLCRKCAHTAGPATLSCPRCGWWFPYWRSRRWRPDFSPVPGLSAGKDCPRCGRRTTRRHTPFWLRPLRALSFHRCSYRTCDTCGWHGAAFHSRSHRRQDAHTPEAWRPKGERPIAAPRDGPEADG